LPAIRRQFEAHDFFPEFTLTANSLELESRAASAIREGKRMLLAIGGDGTFQGLVNAAYGTDVVLGVVPAGGGNDFAAALGLPDDPIAAAAALLRSTPKWVDLVLARTADGRQRLYLGGGGIGLDEEAAQYASGAFFRHLPGRLRYVASALRALCSYRPLLVRAEFPESNQPAIEAKALLACVLNTPTYGAGIRLAPDAQIDDGWLSAVLVEKLSAFQVISLLPRLTGTGELRTPRIKRVLARRVRLCTDRPAMFHGDGESLGPTPVDIQVIPQAVRVLAPTKP
jgi:diacylglycerol kinase (ATP)